MGLSDPNTLKLVSLIFDPCHPVHIRILLDAMMDIKMWMVFWPLMPHPQTEVLSISTARYDLLWCGIGAHMISQAGTGSPTQYVCNLYRKGGFWQKHKESYGTGRAAIMRLRCRPSMMETAQRGQGAAQHQVSFTVSGEANPGSLTFGLPVCSTAWLHFRASQS